MSNEIILRLAYDNYDNIQHINFIFLQISISLFLELFNDKLTLG
jgi:hypothetical protein